MSKLLEIVEFIEKKRKILASLFFVIGLFCSLVVITIYLQRPQNLLSEAKSSEVIFKNSHDEILPISENGLFVSESTKVLVELNPVKTPRFYKIGHTLLELDHAKLNLYTNPPIKFSYHLNLINNSFSTLFVEFIYNYGESKKITSLIEINPPRIDTYSKHPIEFLSPMGKYKLSLDQGMWNYSTHEDEDFGSRTIFNLNKEYGSGRLDILEGETKLDLESLKNEIIQKSSSPPASVESLDFNGSPSYLIRYKKEVFGQDTQYSQQLIKDEDNFFIFETKVPQLTYSKFFLDNLLQNISFISLDSETVKGVSDSSVDLSTTQLVDLVRPSIASIIYSYCVNITNLKPSLSGLSKPQYNFCTFTKGSGFIVSEKGIVATNGHVVKIYPEEGLVTNLLNERNKHFSTDLIRTIYLSKGQNPTPKQIEDFYKETNLNPQYLDLFLTEIFRLLKDKVISINITNEKYYLNVGSLPVKINGENITPSLTTYHAKLLDTDYPNKYSYEAIINRNYSRGLDVALLRINPTSHLFPALKLGGIENLRVGSDIVIAGYPTLVEGDADPRAAISYKTSTTPTITKGIISAIKEDLSGRKILQTDASIDHGNSGGPAYNSSGEVIGIATFAAESKSGNFNFLRDVTELKELMKKNNVDNKLGKVTTLWEEGLNNFRSKRFSKAIAYLKQVETLSPSHPSVKEFIERSQEGIAKGESLEGITGFIKGESSNIILIIFGSLSIMSFMLSGFFTVIPLFEKVQYVRR